MRYNQELKNINVLVTRPKPFGETLCQLIKEHAGQAFYFPTIDIVALPEAEIGPKLQNLAAYDFLIFTSPQAVNYSSPFLEGCLPPIIAVGEGTARALNQANLAVASIPQKNWNTEGLLALPELTQVEGKKIAIIKGKKGRGLLTQELKSRGALTQEIDVYERVLPVVDDQELSDLKTQLKAQQINIIVCTSIDGILNLKMLLSPVLTNLNEIPLLVVSERLQKAAQDLGFKKIFLSPNANNAVILDALVKMRKQYMNNTTENSVPKTHSKWGKFFLWLLVAAIILSGLAYASYLFYAKTFVKQSQFTQMATQLHQELTEINAQSQKLTETVGEQTQIINALRQAQENPNHNMWRILEAEYLVKLANNKLQFDSNIEQAIQLLTTADQSLRDLNNADLDPVRKALADDIAALQGSPKVDVSGIYMQLNAINGQINHLPLLSKPTPDKSTPTPIEENLPWWKKGLHQTWQALKQIVIVRYHESGKPPLVIPEEQDFLYQNIHAEIENAMWALLHKQPEIYRASLQQAMTWIKQYFVSEAPATQSVLTNLQQLQAIDIHPAVPKISESQQAFHDYLASRTAVGA